MAPATGHVGYTCYVCDLCLEGAIFESEPEIRLSCYDVIHSFTQDLQRTTVILTGSCLCIIMYVISAAIWLSDGTCFQLLPASLNATQ